MQSQGAEVRIAAVEAVACWARATGQVLRHCILPSYPYSYSCRVRSPRTINSMRRILKRYSGNCCAEDGDRLGMFVQAHGNGRYVATPKKFLPVLLQAISGQLEHKEIGILRISTLWLMNSVKRRGGTLSWTMLQRTRSWAGRKGHPHLFSVIDDMYQFCRRQPGSHGLSTMLHNQSPSASPLVHSLGQR